MDSVEFSLLFQSSAAILSVLIFILTMLVNMFHDHLGLVWYKHPLVLLVDAFSAAGRAERLGESELGAAAHQHSY